MDITFNVSKDADAKKAGDVHEVEFEIIFDLVDDELIHKHAVANMVVAWQNQIRSNWEKFIADGLPDSITFGVPLYESRRAAPMTEDNILRFIESLPEDKREEFLAKLG